MIPRFRVWSDQEKRLIPSEDILAIDYENEEIDAQKIYFEDGLPVERDIYTYGFENIKLMQSTGLTDKNGKEIFEGDIIDSTDGFLTGVIEFKVGLGMFVSELVEYNSFERLCNVASSRKIIGNIWEHPELAEVSS